MTTKRFMTKGKGAGRKVIPLKGKAAVARPARELSPKELDAFARKTLVAGGRAFGKTYSAFDAGAQVKLSEFGVDRFPEGVEITDDMYHDRMDAMVDSVWPFTYDDFNKAYAAWVDRLAISDNAKEWLKKDDGMQGDFQEAVRDMYDVEKDIEAHVPEFMQLEWDDDAQAFKKKGRPVSKSERPHIKEVTEGGSAVDIGRPYIKEVMTMDEVKALYKHNIDEGMINTGSKPRYKVLADYVLGLKRIGVRVKS